MLIYNAANKHTFEQIKEAIQVPTDLITNIYVVAVTFLSPNREVDEYDGKMLAKSCNAKYFELDNSEEKFNSMMMDLANCVSKQQNAEPLISDPPPTSSKHPQLIGHFPYVGIVDQPLLQMLEDRFPPNLSHFDSYSRYFIDFQFSAENQYKKLELVKDSRNQTYLLYTLKNIVCDQQQLSKLLLQ